MTARNLSTLLNQVTDRLTHERVPYALIGAMALGRYGLPRFTADIDLLTEGRHWSKISKIMTDLGFACFQKAPSFVQFDSKKERFGNIDFLFVDTPDGVNILTSSVGVDDDILGGHPVVQPTDYLVLKLMAIANNPDRLARDEADILAVLKLADRNLIPEAFQPLDLARLRSFAERFGQTERLKGYLRSVRRKKPNTSGTFVL